MSHMGTLMFSNSTLLKGQKEKDEIVVNDMFYSVQCSVAKILSFQHGITVQRLLMEFYPFLYLVFVV